MEYALARSVVPRPGFEPGSPVRKTGILAARARVAGLDDRGSTRTGEVL